MFLSTLSHLELVVKLIWTVGYREKTGLFDGQFTSSESERESDFA